MLDGYSETWRNMEDQMFAGVCMGGERGRVELCGGVNVSLVEARLQSCNAPCPTAWWVGWVLAVGLVPEGRRIAINHRST